jgi:hypothetical protein
VVVKVTCTDQPCKLAARGNAGMAANSAASGLVAGSTLKLRKAVRDLASGTTEKLKLKIRKKGADGEVLRRYRKLARAVRRGETVTAAIDATAADEFGNESSDGLTVELEG